MHVHARFAWIIIALLGAGTVAIGCTDSRSEASREAIEAVASAQADLAGPDGVTEEQAHLPELPPRARAGDQPHLEP